MAKGEFQVHDEDGHLWLVRPGDPAYELMLAVPSEYKRNYPYLPAKVIATGCISEETLEAAVKLQSKLLQACKMVPDDDDLEEALVRVAHMRSLLRAIAQKKEEPND